MKSAIYAAVAAVMVAGPAWAECFDETVLSRGLTIRYDNGDWTTIRRTSGGYQQVDENYASGDPLFRFRAHRGIYFVEEFEPDASGRPVEGTGLRVEFPVDPATLPEPAAGASWQGNTVNIFDDGTTRPEAASIRFSEGPTLPLSGCDYTSLQADVFYDWGDEGWLRLRYAYLPQIGTAMLLTSQFDGDDVFSYLPVALERASK